MTAALIAASAVLTIVFFMSLPFRVDSHTALSIKRLFVVENVRLFRILTVALSFKIEGGKLLFNGNPIKKKPKKTASEKRGIAPSELFKDLNVVSVELRGAYGNASDAASTAVVCGSIITIFDLIKNTNLLKTRKFIINFTPIFHRNILDFDLKIALKINIFMIIFAIIKILRRR